jgi:hypothetical protein
MIKKMLLQAFVVLTMILVCFPASNLFGDGSTEADQPLAPQRQTSNFYIPVSVVTEFSNGLPYVEISIEGRPLLVTLDLGCSGMVQLFEEHIGALSAKTLLGESPTWGIRGTSATTRIYRIPKISIGRLIFENIFLQEDSRVLANESVIVSAKTASDPQVFGNVGWKLFQPEVLFLDLGNALIGVSDCIDALKNQGLPLETFIRVPLLSNRNLLEIDAVTPDGPLRCLLDTGCTWNFLHRENPLDEPLDTFIFRKENDITFSSFQIGEKDFGEISFYAVPIKIPIPIEAVLGMEFFVDHQVVLDFQNGYAYFAPNPN